MSEARRTEQLEKIIDLLDDMKELQTTANQLLNEVKELLTPAE